MFPVVPLLLLAGGLGATGYGVYEHHKQKGDMPKKGSPNLAPIPPPKPSDDGSGLMEGTPPELVAATQALIATGKDPKAMRLMAAELDKYGYTELSSQLKARAAQLEAPKPAPQPSPSPIPNIPNIPNLPGPTPQPTPQPTTQTAITTTDVNTRTGPGVSNPLVSPNDAWKGSTVKVLDWNAGPADSAAPQGWAKIVTPGGATGYASKAYLQLQSGGGGLSLPSIPNLQDILPVASQSAEATATASTSVNTRVAPNASAALVSPNDVFAGKVVKVLNWNAAPPDSVATKGWAQIVTPGGATGYASKAYLTLNAPAPSTSGEEVVVVGADGKPKARMMKCVAPSGCRLRQGPNSTSPFKTMVERGADVLVLKQLAGSKAERLSPGQQGGWSLVRYKKIAGWLPTEWLV